MSDRLLIFDFDGVIADSEVLANAVLAEELTALGHPTSLDDALHRYMGRRWEDCVVAIEAHTGTALPPGFRDRCASAIQARTVSDIAPVAGVADYLDTLGVRPRCVASSSSLNWLSTNLDRFGLAHHFGDNLFSATVHVTRGKPHPDLFLHAASTLAADPGRAIVIEDSVAGVTAGVAAGMTVIGLCAGSHAGGGYAERLQATGAHHTARSYAELADIVRSLG